MSAFSNMKFEQDVQEMKHNNHEKFKTLVRMHLSFELHLNTDELDFPCNELSYYEKGKLKVWNRLSKKIKSCSSVRSSNSLETLPVVLTEELINGLRHLKNFILKEENVRQEGIFRKNGAITRQNELKASIMAGKLVSLDGEYTAHDCASVFKAILSDIYEPILTDAHYSAYSQLADLCNKVRNEPNVIREEHLLRSIQLLLLLLPNENRTMMIEIIEMLVIVAQNEKYNKMSADTLATLFSPHLICPRNLPPEVLHSISQTMCSVLSYMISNGCKIFDTPPKLATDIRAYLVEKKRKRKDSTEAGVILNESVSDMSTVNTVFTFVDREKTAEAHNSNSTDTALAQLYAHIQSLPESSRKRKLIKQFNKENGQGTPLQLMMLNQINSVNNSRCAKSISDSIKRHFLQKGFLCRTPKRKRATPTFDTPNSRPSASKFRVLFDLSNSQSREITKSQEINISQNITEGTLDGSSEILEENENNCDKSDQKELDTEKRFPFNRSLFARHKSEPNLSRLQGLETSIKKQKLRNNKSDCLSAARDFKSDEDIVDQRISCTTIPNKENENEVVLSEKKERNIGIPCTFKDLLVRRVMNRSSLEGLQRRSVSPITKSTQKMPRSMQESIMTPRSRKPVMLTYTLNSSGQTNGLDLSSFQHETEYLNSDSSDVFFPEDRYLRRRSRSVDDIRNKSLSYNTETPESSTGTLTSAFREYLVSRNVYAGSPTDSSFSSQSGDFEVDTEFEEIDQISGNSSLLYCLDGNVPLDSTLCNIAVNSNSVIMEPTGETIDDFDETVF